MSLLHMMAVGSQEDEAIDQTGSPLTQYVEGTQAPPPFNTNTMFTVADRSFSYLPDPTVGGRPAPGNINGANPGPVGGWRGQHRAFDGIIGWFPAITQQMQGNVGRTNRAARQYQGVLDQLATQTFSPLQSAAASVGIQFPYEVQS